MNTVLNDDVLNIIYKYKHNLEFNDVKTELLNYVNFNNGYEITIDWLNEIKRDWLNEYYKYIEYTAWTDNTIDRYYKAEICNMLYNIKHKQHLNLKYPFLDIIFNDSEYKYSTIYLTTKFIKSVIINYLNEYVKNNEFNKHYNEYCYNNDYNYNQTLINHLFN